MRPCALTSGFSVSGVVSGTQDRHGQQHKAGFALGENFIASRAVKEKFNSLCSGQRHRPFLSWGRHQMEKWIPQSLTLLPILHFFDAITSGGFKMMKNCALKGRESIS